MSIDIDLDFPYYVFRNGNTTRLFPFNTSTPELGVINDRLG
jgi:hypothetical protein